MASTVNETEISIGETRRRLGDRYREHPLRDVEKDDRNSLNWSRDTFEISVTNLSNIWKSVAFPYIKEARKAAKRYHKEVYCFKSVIRYS